MTVFYVKKEKQEITIENCYDSYWHSMVTIANSIVHHYDLSEDIIQDIFTELWSGKNPKIVESTLHLKNLLYLTARCRALDWLRKNSKGYYTVDIETIELFDYYADPAHSLIQRDTLRVMYSFLRKQNFRDQKIFFLRIMEGCSVKEVAAKVGIAPVTVYAVLDKLKKQITKLCC